MFSCLIESGLLKLLSLGKHAYDTPYLIPCLELPSQQTRLESAAPTGAA